MKLNLKRKQQPVQERLQLNTPLTLISHTKSGIIEASDHCTVAQVFAMLPPDGCELMPLEYRLDEALKELAKVNGLKAVYAKRRG